MTRHSAIKNVLNPLGWHMEYWLALGSVGILRGEDPLLMSFRIEMEHDKMHPMLKEGFRATWNEFRAKNDAKYQRHWTQMSLESDEAKCHIRDIDRMLVNKGQKARKYLDGIETRMDIALHESRFDEARQLFQGLTKVYAKLQEEETRDAARDAAREGAREAIRDAEARDQLQIDLDRASTQGGQGPQEIAASGPEIIVISDDDE